MSVLHIKPQVRLSSRGIRAVASITLVREDRADIAAIRDSRPRDGLRRIGTENCRNSKDENSSIRSHQIDTEAAKERRRAPVRRAGWFSRTAAQIYNGTERMGGSTHSGTPSLSRNLHYWC